MNLFLIPASGIYEYLEDQRHLHLTELIIDNFKGSFETFELSVKQTPNLQSLTIVCLFSQIMIRSRSMGTIDNSIITSFKALQICW